MALHDDKEAEKLQKIYQRYERLDDAEIDEVLRNLLADQKGQRLIWWLLQRGKYGAQPFSSDPQITAFNCGELNVGQQIMARLIEVNPLGFAQLQQVRKNEDERRSADIASTIGNSDDDSGSD